MPETSDEAGGNLLTLNQAVKAPTDADRFLQVCPPKPEDIAYQKNSSVALGFNDPRCGARENRDDVGPGVSGDVLFGGFGGFGAGGGST